MSGKIRILRVMANPKKKTRRKKRAGRSTRARPGRWQVRAMIVEKHWARAEWLGHGGRWHRQKNKARTFATEGAAAVAAKEGAPHCPKSCVAIDVLKR